MVPTSLKDWIAAAVDGQLNFREVFLKSNNWVVVPVESGCHFDDIDIQNLAAALRISDQLALNAVLIDPLATEAESCIVTDANEEGLRKLNREISHLNYVLLPEDCSFALICTTDDYFLVAGQMRFVAKVLQTPIDQARQDFDVFLNNGTWVEGELDHLLDVADRYRHCNG